MDLEQIMQMNTFAVVGDTLNPEKYAYKIKEGLLEQGYTVHSVGKELQSLNEIPGDLDIIDLCINPAKGIQLLRADSAKQCVAAFVADDVRLSLGGQRLLKAFGVLREIIDDGDSQQHARTPFYLDDTTAADFLHPPLAQENVRLRKN